MSKLVDHPRDQRQLRPWQDGFDADDPLMAGWQDPANADFPRGMKHLLDRFLADPAALVQHAIDGRGADACARGDIRDATFRVISFHGSPSKINHSSAKAIWQSEK
jgi:hypothetical protein